MAREDVNHLDQVGAVEVQRDRAGVIAVVAAGIGCHRAGSGHRRFGRLAARRPVMQVKACQEPCDNPQRLEGHGLRTRKMRAVQDPRPRRSNLKPMRVRSGLLRCSTDRVTVQHWHRERYLIPSWFSAHRPAALS